MHPESIFFGEFVVLQEDTSVTFQLDATLLDSLNDPITNDAEIIIPAGVLELAPASNHDTDTDLIGLFADSFKSVEP